MEQELSSIITYIMKLAGNGVKKYLRNFTADFKKPSIYFPAPEMRIKLSSFGNFEVQYMWLVKIFDTTPEGAYSRASQIVLEIAKNDFFIPLTNTDGQPSGRYFPLLPPSAKLIDNGVCTLEINWNSIRTYNQKEVEKMQRYHINWQKISQLTTKD